MHDVVENAVYTEANSKIFFVRLDVDVGCAATQRVDHQHVDESDNRSVFTRFRELREIDLFVFG